MKKSPSFSISFWLGIASLYIGLTPFNDARAQSPAQLVNNSTRAMVGIDDAISIEEFVIEGDQPKKIIVRGLGPSLGASGVPNPLQDPTLVLYTSSGAVVASNDDWRATQEAEIEATGLAPSDDLESAIVMTLPPGTYATALVGKNNATGTGLNEVYDLEEQNSLITAIGARDNALPGDDVVISGFILTGTDSQSFLLRALGPSLAAYGIAGPLLDPALELHDPNGSIIASNDNWQDTQGSEIQATGLAPTDSRESAILATLSPGAYTTVEIRSSGITFVETYALPYDGGPLNPAPIPTPPPSGEVEFVPTGFLSGDDTSEIRAVNGDGTAATGYSAHLEGNFLVGMPTRWNTLEGTQALPMLPDNPNAGSLHNFVSGKDISPGGAWISYSGHTKDGGTGIAAGLSSGDGSSVTALSSLPGGEAINVAFQISDDGLIVFGKGSVLGFGDGHSVRWSASDGFQVLAEPPGYTNSFAQNRAISADGSVSVGDMYGYDGNFDYAAYQAYRWTASGGMQGIGYLPGGARSASLGLSSDGTTILGFSTSTTFPGTPGSYPSDGEFFRWAEATGITALGRPVGYESDDYLLANLGGISADGTLGVVGVFNFQIFDGKSFVLQTETAQYLEVQQVLLDAGAAVSDWTDFSALGISDDGNTIFGSATNPDGNTEGFIARFSDGYLRNLFGTIPVITSPLVESGTVGQAFSYQITATNSPTSFGASGLPAGLSVNTSTGLISGTPSAAGTFVVTLSASNAAGTGTAVLSLTLSMAASAPVITSATTATATVGQAFSYQITATNSPTSFGASGLPSGLSVNTSTGLISGTPSAAGTSAVTLSATNAAGTGMGVLTLTVNLAAPVIISPPVAGGIVGVPFRFRSWRPISQPAMGQPTCLQA